MPTYRYRCEKCGEELEVWQSITDPPLTTHDEDGGELRKVLSAAGIVLKGSGFYKTDSRSGNGKGGARRDKKESTDSGSSKESGSSKDSSSSSKDSSGSSSSSGSTSGSTSST